MEDTKRKFLEKRRKNGGLERSVTMKRQDTTIFRCIKSHDFDYRPCDRLDPTEIFEHQNYI